MRRLVSLVVAGSVVAALASGAQPALAAGAVIRNGSCGGGGSWTLQLNHEDRGLEVDVEIHAQGGTWAVQLSHDGRVFFRTTRRLVDGSFTVQRVAGVVAGTHRFGAVARSTSSGAVCRGTAAMAS
jgi:2-methylaconitate cis-trans-isomerase PrpF